MVRELVGYLKWKFHHLFLLTSEDLKRQNAVLQAAQDDLEQLRTQLVEAQAEMENIKAIATVSENTKQEAIDEVKRQWQEEVASLQAIMKGRAEGSGWTAASSSFF